ncbi:MAG: hypothetical protein ABL897_05600 [Hyphomicrobium sp.]
MLRTLMVTTTSALLMCQVSAASAQVIDSLQGQFAFNWHTEPAKTTCAAVDAQLLAKFKSDAYQCNLDVITNTASGEPARVCTEHGDGAEYLIFQTQKSCDEERLTQASNSEE